MDRDPLDVVIVGGSLAGLWTAIAIKAVPHVRSITILERLNKHGLQDLGAGIRCSPEPIEVYKDLLGLAPAKYASCMNYFRMLNQAGEYAYGIPVKGWTTTWGQLYRIYRESFDHDPKCVYRLECTVTDLKEVDAAHMEVEFTNEENETEQIPAHLVVGADGASSALRSLMLPNIKRTTAGYVLYRGVVPKSMLSSEALDVYDDAATFSLPAQTGQFASYTVPGNEAPADEAISCVNWGLYHNVTEQEAQQLLIDREGKSHRFTLPRKA